MKIYQNLMFIFYKNNLYLVLINDLIILEISNYNSYSLYFNLILFFHYPYHNIYFQVINYNVIINYFINILILNIFIQYNQLLYYLIFHYLIIIFIIQL